MLDRHVLVFVFATFGCSNAQPANDSGTPTDAGSKTDSPAGNDDAGGDAGGTCSTLPLPFEHSIVVETLGMPMGKGGAIVDGTYELSGPQYYYAMNDKEDAGAPMGKVKGAMKLTGNKFERVFQLGTNSVINESGTWSTSNVDITFTITCPSAGTDPSTYSFIADDAGVVNLVINRTDGIQLGYDKK